MDVFHISFLFRLIILGEGSYIIREKLLGKNFSSNYPLKIGADFVLKEMKIKDHTIKFQFWDLTPLPKFEKIRSVYFYCAMGIIIFYNKSDKESFKRIHYYLKEFKNHNGKGIELFAKDQLNIIGIIDNDLDINISTNEGESLAQSLGMKYYEMKNTYREKINNILFKIGKSYLDQIFQF